MASRAHGHFREARRVGLVVVASSDRRGRLPVDDLLELKLRGVAIEEGTQFYERVTGKIFVPELRPSQLIFARDFQVRRRTLALKRALDVVLSAIGLVLGAPLFLLAAIAASRTVSSASRFIGTQMASPPALSMVETTSSAFARS